MEFTSDDETNSLRTRAPFRGGDVLIRLRGAELRPKVHNEAMVSDALRFVDSRWVAIVQVLEGGMYDTYCRCWASDGRPLDKSAFLSALSVRSVEVEVEGPSTTSVFLNFDVVELFGGHSVEVFLDGESHEIDVDLVG